MQINKNLEIANNRKLAKIKLVSRNENYDGIKATVAGFGYNSIDLIIDPKTGKTHEANGKSPDGMRFATAKVVNNKDCQKHFTKHVTDKHICAALLQRKPNKPEGLCSVS